MAPLSTPRMVHLASTVIKDETLKRNSGLVISSAVTTTVNVKNKGKHQVQEPVRSKSLGEHEGGKACNANACFDVASCGDSRALFRASSNQVPTRWKQMPRFVAQN